MDKMVGSSIFRLRGKRLKPERQTGRSYFSSILLLLICFSQSIAQENPHKQENLNCETCHVSTTWNQIQFNHDVTKFALVDRHQEVDCKSCHNIEDFRTTSSDCFTCHADVHQAKMGGDCEKCHSFAGWEIFNVEEIHADTQFPMIGRHTLVDCQSCHQNQPQGDFALLTTDCVSCHQQAYLATENPNHVSNSFSTNCQECHGMDDWQPAFLPNHDAFFPIFSGEHDGAWSDCVICHQNPATFIDFTCLTCHKHRQSKMDEEHRGIAGYAYESNACLSCHPTGEEGEFKEHDNRFFPIFTGKHAGEWEECSACHNNTVNRQEFTCLVCHEHSQSEMDSKHQGIAGFAYESNACLICHPAGEEGDFKEHDTQFFPIFTGEHAGEWDECLTCHKNPTNRQEFTCLVCHEHRQSKMDPKHEGFSGYAYDSNSCFGCHPTGEEGDFDHSVYFPISRRPHKRDCIDCHVDPGNFQRFECIQCHEHRQQKMDEKHRNKNDYVWESNACLNCHPDGKE